MRDLHPEIAFMVLAHFFYHIFFRARGSAALFLKGILQFYLPISSLPSPAAVVVLYVPFFGRFLLCNILAGARALQISELPE